MSLTNEKVVQIYKKHNGSMNGVHKEICQTLHIDSCQINKSSLHWKIKKIIKEFERLNKSISKKSIYEQYKRKEFKCPSKTNKEPASTCVPSETDTEKITTRTEQDIIISQLKMKILNLKKKSEAIELKKLTRK